MVALLRAAASARSTSIQDGDLEMIAQPIDFLGVNFYRPNWAAAVDDGSVLDVREVAPDARAHLDGLADRARRR